MLNSSKNNLFEESSVETIYVPKWPFYIADGILICFSSALFVHAGGQPSPAVLLLAVVLVIIGAAVFLCPFLFELLLRYRFLLDQWSHITAHSMVDERLIKVETKIMALLKKSESLEGLDDKISHLREAVDSITTRINTLDGDFQHHCDLYQQKQSSLPKDEKIIPSDEDQDVKTISNPIPESVVISTKSPNKIIEQRLESPKQSLLHRAIEKSNGNADTPAVNRIIGRTFTPLSSSAIDTNPDTVETVSANIESSTTNEKSEIYTKSATPANEQPDDTLFPQMPVSTRRAVKPKLNETVILAKILIGIGNTPYIRGNLPGLSLNKGVPMEFKEIGIWQWVSSEVKTVGEIRIFRNDQDPEKDPSHSISPGQHFEIQPQF
jgi:hypothetical protein